MTAILAYVEHADGHPDRLSLEMLALAGRLAAATDLPVHAALAGAGAREAAGELGGYGVSTAHVIEHDQLVAYAPAALASSVGQLASALSATAVLAPGSELGTEILAYLGAQTGLPMAANVIDVVPGDRWRVTRQRWAGSVLEEAWLEGSPHLLTVAPHAVVPNEPTPTSAAPSIVSMTPTLTDRDVRVRVTGQVQSMSDKISLTDARVVVGGGRGIGSAEGFAMLEELASLLGGAVGGSRVVTSAGWRPHADQIGQTGVRIAPELYIACGISGAIQHIVGCKAAKRILAINTDPDAPIMSHASYAVIGDLHAIVPAITAEIRRTGGGAAG